MFRIKSYSCCWSRGLRIDEIFEYSETGKKFLSATLGQLLRHTRRNILWMVQLEGIRGSETYPVRNVWVQRFRRALASYLLDVKTNH